MPSITPQFVLSSSTAAKAVNDLDPVLVASLPVAWLESLKEAAVCVQDQAIVERVTELSTHLALLGAVSMELVRNDQFEQIVQLFHGDSLP